MKQVLLVEDSNMFGRIIKKKVEQTFDVPVFWAKTMADADTMITAAKGDFSLALLDFNLPDAPRGEIIDRVIGEGISSVVFTSDVTPEVRKEVWSKKVADYILKEDPNCLDQIVSVIRQLEENSSNLILVVDDSKTYRTYLSELLYVQKYRVLNASDGESCLDILGNYPEVKLVIIDQNMPGMDGCSVCQKIRSFLKPDRTALIGLSAETDESIGARFIKSGANDFIVKNKFLVEEFYSRVNHCLETVNLFEKLREAAIKDHLSGLYNRRYFFEAGERLFAQSRKTDIPVACVMLDIDHFKRVNDNYGHDAGDLVIKNVAAILKSNSGKEDVLARIGGEEFCLLCPAVAGEEVVARIEALRQDLATTEMALPGRPQGISVTISAGISWSAECSLHEAMKAADDCLYRAKEGGRNQVVSLF